MGATSTEIIDEVLAIFSGLVSKDGGQLVLLSYDPESRIVETVYREGTNEACPTCVISQDSMEVFLLDSLRARGMEVDVVKARPPM